MRETKYSFALASNIVMCSVMAFDAPARPKRLKFESRARAASAAFQVVCTFDEIRGAARNTNTHSHLLFQIACARAFVHTTPKLSRTHSSVFRAKLWKSTHTCVHESLSYICADTANGKIKHNSADRWCAGPNEFRSRVFPNIYIRLST